MPSLKRAIANMYVWKSPEHYEVPFAGSRVRFLADRPYSKQWYYRNRLKRSFNGYHEPGLTLFLEALTSAKTNLFDVGSHLGYFSVLFASLPGKEAVAIELDPSNFRELARCIDFQPDPIRRSIRALNVGIADTSGTIELPESRPHDSSHRIAHDQSRRGETIAVPLMTIDEVVKQHGRIPDIVKIDVEGYEVKALRGAQTTLTVHKPTLLIEVHPPQIRQEGNQVSDLFAITTAAGYEHYRFVAHRSRKGSQLTRDLSSGEGNWDVVCIHQTDTATLAIADKFLV